MQPPRKKWFSPDFVENSLKIGKYFQAFAVFAYGLKDFRVNLIDIGLHIPNLLQNNIA